MGTGANYKDDNEDPDIGVEREKVEEAKSRPSNYILSKKNIINTLHNM